ncbi:MAG: hypothetical protein IH856_15065 [Deltaproteobacteria bacterium]|nr:hypothetical protein [Deltaproteobacteria bacterium]
MLDDCQLLSALKSLSNQKLIILLKIMGSNGIQGGQIKSENHPELGSQAELDVASIIQLLVLDLTDVREADNQLRRKLPLGQVSHFAKLSNSFAELHFRHNSVA